MLPQGRSVSELRTAESLYPLAKPPSLRRSADAAVSEFCSAESKWRLARPLQRYVRTRPRLTGPQGLSGSNTIFARQ